MHKTFLLVAFILIANILVAQANLSIDSIGNHLSENVTICSTVFGVKSTESITFINLGAAYPKSPLTIVIFAKDLPNFKESPSSMYENKQICVTGTLTDYKGKTQIVVTKPQEIIVE